MILARPAEQVKTTASVVNRLSFKVRIRRHNSCKQTLRHGLIGPVRASSPVIMRSATWLFFLFAVSCLNASVAPLTVKEVALMLRSGYASGSVLAELTKRKCADTPDATAEKQLIQAGASQALLEALRSGAYQVSPQQVATNQDQ